MTTVKRLNVSALVLCLFAAPVVSAATWTKWLNRDDPSGNGDYEERSKFAPDEVCTHPTAIEAFTIVTLPELGQLWITVTPESYANSAYDYWDQYGDVLYRFSPEDGLICRNFEQYLGNARCENYMVRFLCP